MRMRPVVLLSIVMGACFSEGPEGNDPTGDEPTTTDTADPSMTSTSTASTTTVDPTMTSATGDATGTTDPTDTLTTADPTTDPTTTTDPTAADSSSSGEPPIEENVVQDFLVEADNAGWTNDMGAVLSFPVYPGDAAAPSGHAFLASDAHMVPIDSTGDVFTDDAIVMHPRFAPDGEVRGRFEGKLYMAGDRFRTHAYCVQNTSCSVQLVMGQSIEQSAPAIVQMWPISVDDEEGVEIDFELMGGGFTPGIFTELSLMVFAGPDSASDSLLLERPRIVRP